MLSRQKVGFKDEFWGWGLGLGFRQFRAWNLCS